METLVTTLKGSVNDDELRKIGEMRIYLANSAAPDYANRRIRITSNPSQTLTCLGNGSFSDGSGTPTSKTATAGTSMTTLVLANGEFQVSVPSKYDLEYIEARNGDVSFNIDDFVYCNKLVTAYGVSKNDKGCLASLKGLQALEDFRFSNIESGLYGDIKDLPKSLIYLTLTAKNIIGDIASLGGHNLLRMLQINDSGITGTLESFCEAQAILRSSEDSISINLVRTAITYNGVVVDRLVTVTFDGQGGYVIS